MKRIVCLILVCLLLVGLCACSGEPSLVDSSNSADKNTTEKSTADNTEKSFTIGDSVELNDVIVKFVGITKSTGSQYNKPADGNVYILCEFEITNNSKEELSVSSMLSFDAYCDDYACDYSIGALMEKGNKDQLDGAVAAGKKMKGVIGYEVPTDWEELEIQYTLDILDDAKITFVATNG